MPDECVWLIWQIALTLRKPAF
jgi:ABC-type Fe3+/spermidine/putrescine transport system ATPase subunit